MNETVYEAFQKIIPVYEKAVEELPEDFYDTWRYCQPRALGYGICYYANKFWSGKIHHDLYLAVIAYFREAGWGYIFKSVNCCETRSEILESLQYRLDFMQKAVKEYEQKLIEG